jgi:hypothetical protein
MVLCFLYLSHHHWNKFKNRHQRWNYIDLKARPLEDFLFFKTLEIERTKAPIQDAVNYNENTKIQAILRFKRNLGILSLKLNHETFFIVLVHVSKHRIIISWSLSFLIKSIPKNSLKLTYIQEIVDKELIPGIMFNLLRYRLHRLSANTQK